MSINPHFSFTGIQSRIHNIFGNILIFDCLFIKLSYSYGGSILISGSNEFNIIIEKSIFINSTTTNGDGGTLILSGGALYINSISSSIFLNKICAYGCYTHGSLTNNYHGQFAILSSSYNKINSYNYLSISHCAPNFLDSSQSSCMNSFYGIKDIINCNFSKNFVKITSCISINSNLISNIYFLNSINNTARLHATFIFRGINDTKIINSNIINNINTDLNTIWGIFSIQDPIFILNSCIIKFNDGLLSSIYEKGTINVNNCFILHNYNFGVINSGYFLINTPSFLLFHFQTALCLAENHIKNSILFKNRFINIPIFSFIFIFS